MFHGTYMYGPESPRTHSVGTPVLAHVTEDPMSPYSDAQWEKMLGYNFENTHDVQPLRKDFYDAVNQLANRDMKLSAKYTTPSAAPTRLAHQQVHAQIQQGGGGGGGSGNSTKPTVAALVTWCGYSKKALASHKQYGVQDKVQELFCDKQDSNHPLCKQTKGFPTYYKADGTVIKRGYPVQDPQAFYKSL